METPKIRKELPQVYSVMYQTQYEMCMGFCRFEEFYECPSKDFRGKYFEFEDYMDYWSLTYGNGGFSYPALWNGFNISGKFIVRWKKKFAHDIRPREANLIDAISKRLSDDKLKDAYVIGLYRDDEDLIITKRHELAHAMYCTFPEYRVSCKKLVKSRRRLPIYANAKKELKETGYGDDQVEDEMQAYWSTSPIDFEDDTYLNGDKEFMDNFKKFYRLRRQKKA